MENPILGANSSDSGHFSGDFGWATSVLEQSQHSLLGSAEDLRRLRWLSSGQKGFWVGGTVLPTSQPIGTDNVGKIPTTSGRQN
jgi:hypothetical protein